MFINVFLMVLGAAAAECVPPKPNHPQSPVGASAPALGWVSIEIPLIGPIGEPKSILTVLNERDIKATLLTTRDWALRHQDFLKEASGQGHEIGIWLSLKHDVGFSAEFARQPDLADWVSALRRSRKAIRKITGQTARSVGMSTLPPLGETAAEAMAFRAILPNERTVGDLPQRVKKIDKTKGRARVLGQGRYEDGCGHLLPHWSPAALDRATHAAARANWIRIALPSAEGVGPMLSQWLDNVVIPNQWPVITTQQMAKEAQRPGSQKERSPPSVAVAKRISADQWHAIASAITDSSMLPSHPIPDVNLTEAYFGLVMLLTSDTKSIPVTLGHLKPPTESAARELSGPVTFSSKEVLDMAQSLRASLRGQVPSIISIGDRSVTAAEALQLMALQVLGEPLTSRPAQNPKPFASGCGWGASVGL